MSISDEIAEKVRALGNLVDSLQTETRKAAAKAHQGSSAKFAAEIRGGLGVVEVDIMARLRAIRLDPQQIRRCDAETFAKELVSAINTAEQAARESLDRASRNTSTTPPDPQGRRSAHGR
jgi:DNA-binding protein YbaB